MSGDYFAPWCWPCRDLHDNDLTGTIPTNVGLMTSLTQLYASSPSTLHFAMNDDGY